MIVTVAPQVPQADTILTSDALKFLDELSATFGAPIRASVQARHTRTTRFDFLEETRAVREGAWQCAPIPKELEDRRIEITGPVERKMVINALNSGANVFMADFEDSSCPTWANVIAGQVNLRDANSRTISLNQNGKHYELQPNPAVLFVRPRGLHLPEAHLRDDHGPLAGALVDFGLYAFHNTKILIDRGSAPYFYLPKLESHKEARLWNEIFSFTEAKLGVPTGTFRATVLIETLPAAFEMDEILYELREHSVGLNCGRWDYIFSFIKKQADTASAILPDRAQITMDRGFLRAYAQLLIKTCHARGTFAMGGMAAQIPIKDDSKANEAAMAKVRADKLREVRDGHDGTWVAHPALVPIAKAVFDAEMPGKNQISRQRSDVTVTREDLLATVAGTRTEAGLRHNIRVGVQYIESWLRGNGCVPIYNLMEDAATAEISRAQVWQWLKHGATIETAGGTRQVERAMLEGIVAEEVAVVKGEVGEARVQSGRFDAAAAMFWRLTTEPRFEDFLTTSAYETLVREGL